MKQAAIPTEEKQEKIRVGTALIKQLSSSFYPHPRMLFDEMTSNARDAMATVVKITILEDRIEIEDNGEGMTSEQLVRFFYISHTDKPQTQKRTKNGITREIIGRFGIGKLSLYQLCIWFEIISWRDGVTSSATFNFKEFEENEFIDDFDLKVSSVKNNVKGSGTRLVLHELKQSVSGMKLKRDLMRTMPLTSDFRIVISGSDLDSPVELRAGDIVQGHKYPINDFVEGVGKVRGDIVYKQSESGDFGIFVRVFGRLVNLDNPRDIVDFPSLVNAQQFHRRIYAELFVNGLNDALLTNRSGFVVNHPAYIAFQAWIKKKLNQCNRIEAKWWTEERDKRVTEILPRAIADVLSRDEKPSKDPDSIRESAVARSGKIVSSQPHTKARKEEMLAEEDAEEPSFDFRGERIKIKVRMIPDGPEAVFDKAKKTIVINSMHPMYTITQSLGRGSGGVLYHSFKTAVLFTSLETSKTIEEFRKKYNELISEGERNLSSMKLGGKKSEK